MWWNDLKEVKESVAKIEETLESSVVMDDIDRDIERLHDKLNILIEDEGRKEAVDLAVQTLDKFEDYMKNVNKLNSMINEFKGCVSMARAAMSDKKEMEDLRAVLKNMMTTIKIHYDFQNEMGNKFFKIDAIYKAICENEEKKSPEKKKTVKKNPRPPPHPSE